MIDQNEINIPAFQRKKTLLAKAKRKPNIANKSVRKNLVSLVNDTCNIPASMTSDSEDTYLSRRAGSKKSLVEMKTTAICEGFFENINVAVIRVTSPIRVGDTIIFETTNGLFQQELLSMQQNRKDIQLARSGSEIGIKVVMEPKVGGNVYKVI